MIAVRNVNGCLRGRLRNGATAGWWGHEKREEVKSTGGTFLSCLSHVKLSHEEFDCTKNVIFPIKLCAIF